MNKPKQLGIRSERNEIWWIMGRGRVQLKNTNDITRLLQAIDDVNGDTVSRGKQNKNPVE